MRILIVEDEAPAARRLQRLVAEESGIGPDAIRLADSLDAARAAMAAGGVDILLLDLDLSGRDGFDVLRGVRAERPAAIIVSANIDRALEAFDHDVVDFVAKPVSAKRLARALSRAREARSGEMRLLVRTQGGTDIVNARDILRISGADDYAEIAVADGRVVLHGENLEALEKRLPPTFVRTHRSHIVNMTHVTRLRALGAGKNVAVTRDGAETPVSRRRAHIVKEAIRTKISRADP